MRKALSFILFSILILALSGCVPEKGTYNESKGKTGLEESNKIDLAGDGENTLPASYPTDVLPLAADAIILDVREHPENNGLEVSYVSDNDIGTLCDYYEGKLKDAQDLDTLETEGGYMITAKIDDVYYTIILDKKAMDPIPQYAGKTSVHIMLTGLEGISGNQSKASEDDGKAWPFAELPGVPELKGHISKILLEDDGVFIEMTVENAAVMESYVDEIKKVGFELETNPVLDNDHMEFLAFKDGSLINIGYAGKDNFVSFEYQK